MTRASELATQQGREKLSEAIAAQRNAYTRGFKYVIQRSDGALISNKTSFWTCDLTEALEANESTPCPSKGAMVLTETARQLLFNLMTKEMVDD